LKTTSLSTCFCLEINLRIHREKISRNCRISRKWWAKLIHSANELILGDKVSERILPRGFGAIERTNVEARKWNTLWREVTGLLTAKSSFSVNVPAWRAFNPSVQYPLFMMISIHPPFTRGKLRVQSSMTVLVKKKTRLGWIKWCKLLRFVYRATYVNEYLISMIAIVAIDYRNR